MAPLLSGRREVAPADCGVLGLELVSVGFFPRAVSESEPEDFVEKEDEDAEQEDGAHSSKADGNFDLDLI